MKNVLVTGGAGYVGSILVPKLLQAGFTVKVIDWYLFGEQALDRVADHPQLIQVKGDIRDQELLSREIPGTDAIIHLACISNDPSFELNPELGKSINYDAFLKLVDMAKRCEVKRFIYISSSSVYGIKSEPEVTEGLTLKPLTDYSRYKAYGEEYLLRQQAGDFGVLVLRPATVCGWSPRLRLDLTINLLTFQSLQNKVMTIFGGQQRRPHIHIEDLTDLLVQVLGYAQEVIQGKIYNVGGQNLTLTQTAGLIRETLNDPEIEIVYLPTQDERSYHISSRKIHQELGFLPRHPLPDAIRSLKQAYEEGGILRDEPEAKYYNIKTMQAMNLV